jgi:hypothetical protein
VLTKDKNERIIGPEVREMVLVKELIKDVGMGLHVMWIDMLFKNMVCDCGGFKYRLWFVFRCEVLQ